VNEGGYVWTCAFDGCNKKFILNFGWITPLKEVNIDERMIGSVNMKWIMRGFLSDSWLVGLTIREIATGKGEVVPVLFFN
jgi:hypothetical protein